MRTRAAWVMKETHEILAGLNRKEAYYTDLHYKNEDEFVEWVAGMNGGRQDIYLAWTTPIEDIV